MMVVSIKTVCIHCLDLYKAFDCHGVLKNENVIWRTNHKPHGLKTTLTGQTSKMSNSIIVKFGGCYINVLLLIETWICSRHELVIQGVLWRVVGFLVVTWK